MAYGRGVVAAAILCLASLEAACIGRLEPVGAPPRAHAFAENERALQLHDETVTMHTFAPVTTSARPLLIYATGDGGWRRRDVEVYRHLESWGYPAIGFSSSQYLKNIDENGNQLVPDDVARDFAAVIEAGRAWMDLPASLPVVLVGVSRGADLAVAAAGSAVLQGHLEGLVAIGLSEDEEFVRSAPGKAPSKLALYSYLPRLGDMPTSVVQSTHDGYLPAANARILFGPDTESRQLHAIDARDHSFTNARAAMFEAIAASLDWIEHERPGGRQP